MRAPSQSDDAYGTGFEYLSVRILPSPVEEWLVSKISSLNGLNHFKNINIIILLTVTKIRNIDVMKTL